MYNLLSYIPCNELTSPTSSHSNRNRIAYHLSKLTSDDTQWEQVGMGISEKPGRVSFNLRELETSTSILSVGTVQASGERTSHAAGADTLLVITHWVWEGKTRWAGGTASSLVNMSGCPGRRLVCACYVEKCDFLSLVSNVSIYLEM